MCNKKQIEFWKNECDKINKGENLNFWNLWKNLGENTNENKSFNADGEKWENYYTNLHKNTQKENLQEVEKISNGQSNINLSLNEKFSMNELRSAINSLKNNKSPGYDDRK